MSDERKAILKHDGGEIALPIVEPVLGFSGVDISRLRDDAGLLTLDYGFANTAGTRSAISFVDGAAGALRYRGYPIEQLAEHSSFLEVSYLLFHGELPSAEQLEEYRHQVTVHTLLNEEMKRLFDAFPRRAHPMAILSSATNAMSTFYPVFQSPDDPYAVEQAALRLIAKVPTVAAFAYKKSIGQPYRYPLNDLDYASNFLHMNVLAARRSLRGGPVGGAGPRRAAHPPRRPRPELLHVDGAARRIEQGEPVHVRRGRDECPVGAPARRRQPARRGDARADRSRRRRPCQVHRQGEGSG
jgi:citrate synthase